MKQERQTRRDRKKENAQKLKEKAEKLQAAKA